MTGNELFFLSCAQTRPQQIWKKNINFRSIARAMARTHTHTFSTQFTSFFLLLLILVALPWLHVSRHFRSIQSFTAEKLKLFQLVTDFGIERIAFRCTESSELEFPQFVLELKRGKNEQNFLYIFLTVSRSSFEPQMKGREKEKYYRNDSHIMTVGRWWCERISLTRMNLVQNFSLPHTLVRNSFIRCAPVCPCMWICHFSLQASHLCWTQTSAAA